ncbi:MAG: Bax inhibitor-1/YccA family protein [Micromonosporaceae bacterium]|nr:Bax inhibitor-1/YccA family protein [Micromonosporaceae bacterium]
MRTSNPVLSRLGEAAAAQRAAGYSAGMAYGEPYPTTTWTPPTVRTMTLDDVVVRSVGLLGLTGLSAAVAWAIVPVGSELGFAFTAGLIGVVLGLVISFARITNPLLIGAYAVVEGVAVGLFSKYLENWYDGIVLQAAVATFGIFLIMTALYKTRVIRATPRFTRGVVAAMVGLFSVIMINLVLALFGINTHLRDGSGLAIVFSLVAIVVGALSLVLNFAAIEEGVRYGLPERYAWTCAFGLLVGLIWVYLEILRLLSYLQGRD